MATVIRLSRHGRKKSPYYRVVVQDSRSPRDGKFIEHIGHLNPMTDGPEALKIEQPRLEYWLGTGAQLSESLKSQMKALERAKTRPPKAPKKSKKVLAAEAEAAKKSLEAAPAAAEAPAAEAPAEDKPAE